MTDFRTLQNFPGKVPTKKISPILKKYNWKDLTKLIFFLLKKNVILVDYPINNRFNPEHNQFFIGDSIPTVKKIIHYNYKQIFK